MIILELLPADDILEESGVIHLLNTTVGRSATAINAKKSKNSFGWLINSNISERKDESLASF